MANMVTSRCRTSITPDAEATLEVNQQGKVVSLFAIPDPNEWPFFEMVLSPKEALQLARQLNTAALTAREAADKDGEQP